jgi:hypothetical protein
MDDLNGVEMGPARIGRVHASLPAGRARAPR